MTSKVSVLCSLSMYTRKNMWLKEALCCLVGISLNWEIYLGFKRMHSGPGSGTGGDFLLKSMEQS